MWCRAYGGVGVGGLRIFFDFCIMVCLMHVDAETKPKSRDVGRWSAVIGGMLRDDPACSL